MTSDMKKSNDNLLSSFIENFEKEIDFKSKVHVSEHNQLAKIAELFEVFAHGISLEVKPIKVVGGNNPVAYFDFKTKLSEDQAIDHLFTFFKRLGIAAKKHKFEGSYPIFSIRNNTVPGLIEGTGYSMFSFVSRGADNKISIKLESLRENQIIRTLDSKFINLTLVVWNGRSMSKSTFCIPDDINLEERVPTEDGFFNIQLISNSSKSVLKIKGDFSVSLSEGLILERITEIARA